MEEGQFFYLFVCQLKKRQLHLLVGWLCSRIRPECSVSKRRLREVQKQITDEKLNLDCDREQDS